MRSIGSEGTTSCDNCSNPSGILNAISHAARSREIAAASGTSRTESKAALAQLPSLAPSHLALRFLSPAGRDIGRGCLGNQGWESVARAQRGSAGSFDFAGNGSRCFASLNSSPDESATADMTGGYGLLLDRGERPKLLQRCRPGAIRNTFPSPTPHRLTRRRIDDQLPDGAGQILGIM
jgi:hypothetical protein